jgi:ribonuclease HI
MITKEFHIDGTGARPDGSGSGFAWVRIGMDKQPLYWEDGLTCNIAEYKALIAVLRYVSHGSNLLIRTDSQLVCEQFNGRWAVRDPKLCELLKEASDLIAEKELDVEVKWIPRDQNLAGKLLERSRRPTLA